MMRSAWDTHVQNILEGAKQRIARRLRLDNQRNVMEVPPPFPSPEDWRDQWIYFLMLDRFNNPFAPPRHLPYDSIYVGFQGGSFNGVRSALPYLKELGVALMHRFSCTMAGQTAISAPPTSMTSVPSIR